MESGVSLADCVQRLLRQTKAKPNLILLKLAEPAKLILLMVAFECIQFMVTGGGSFSQKIESANRAELS